MSKAYIWLSILPVGCSLQAEKEKSMNRNPQKEDNGFAKSCGTSSKQVFERRVMGDSVGLESGFWNLCLCHRTVTPLESCMLLWTTVSSSVKCVCAGGVGLDYTRGSGAQSMELVTQPSEVL